MQETDILPTILFDKNGVLLPGQEHILQAIIDSGKSQVCNFVVGLEPISEN